MPSTDILIVSIAHTELISTNYCVDTICHTNLSVLRLVRELCVALTPMYSSSNEWRSNEWKLREVEWRTSDVVEPHTIWSEGELVTDK